MYRDLEKKIFPLKPSDLAASMANISDFHTNYIIMKQYLACNENT